MKAIDADEMTAADEEPSTDRALAAATIVSAVAASGIAGDAGLGSLEKITALAATCLLGGFAVLGATAWMMHASDDGKE